MNKKLFPVFLFALSAVGLPAQNWWEQGLIAHYAFDSISAVDSSLSGVDLNVSPQLLATTNRSAQPDKAVDFAQPNDYVQGSSSHLISGTAPRSFSVWLRVNQLPDLSLPFACPFFYGAQQDKKGQGIVVDDQGRVSYAGYKDSPSSTADVESIGTINEGEWVHIGCSYDGDTAKLYIDGLLDNSGVKVWNTTANLALHFGRMGATGGGQQGGATILLPFDGAVDDFRAYDRELSAVEMFKLSKDDFSVISSGIGLNEQRAPDFSLYPNPTDGLLHISGVQSFSVLEVLSLNGTSLERMENTNTIDVSGLETGVYLLRISSEHTVAYKRFVKF